MTIVDHAILFITGASSGIGAATARRLSAPGQTSTFRDGTKPGWRPWLPPAGRWCSSTQAPVNGPARVGVSTRPRSLVSAPWRTHFGRKSRNEGCGSPRYSPGVPRRRCSRRCIGSKVASITRTRSWDQRRWPRRSCTRSRCPDPRRFPRSASGRERTLPTVNSLILPSCDVRRPRVRRLG
jgi:hypothetical protein